MSSTSGRLMAMGTLFVSGPVYQQRTSDGDLQYLMPMVQRVGMGVREVIAIWIGPAAETFMRQHRSQCRPGQPLNITSDDVFCHSNKLHLHITTCTLAPGRWEGRSGNTNHTTTINNEDMTA